MWLCHWLGSAARWQWGGVFRVLYSTAVQFHKGTWPECGLRLRVRLILVLRWHALRVVWPCSRCGVVCVAGCCVCVAGGVRMSVSIGVVLRAAVCV